MSFYDFRSLRLAGSESIRSKKLTLQQVGFINGEFGPWAPFSRMLSAWLNGWRFQYLAYGSVIVTFSIWHRSSFFLMYKIFLHLNFYLEKKSMRKSNKKAALPWNDFVFYKSRCACVCLKNGYRFLDERVTLVTFSSWWQKLSGPLPFLWGPQIVKGELLWFFLLMPLSMTACGCRDLCEWWRSCDKGSVKHNLALKQWRPFPGRVC